MFAEFSRRDRTIAPVTHVARLNRLVFRGFGDANHVEIAALDVVEHRVFEVGIGLVPQLLFEIDLDVVVFEDTAVTAEDDAAQQLQIFHRQLLRLDLLDGSLTEV